jgi:hypothetical protein
MAHLDDGARLTDLERRLAQIEARLAGLEAERAARLPLIDPGHPHVPYEDPPLGSAVYAAPGYNPWRR